MHRFVSFVNWFAFMLVCVCACLHGDSCQPLLRKQPLEAGDYSERPPAWAVVGVTAYALHSTTNPLFGCLLPQIHTEDLTQDLTAALTLHLHASHCDLAADLLLGSLHKSGLNRSLFPEPGLNIWSVHTFQMCAHELSSFNMWWPELIVSPVSF